MLPTPSQTDQSTMTVSETLVFYGITAAGTLQPRELFRFMEKTGPRWWLPASGMTRHEFWSRAKRVLVARHTRIRTLMDGCHANDNVIVEHVIRHGSRKRSLDRLPEYGFVDLLAVRRESDGAVISDLMVQTVWLDLATGSPRVATTPPQGLSCPDEELPEIDPAPSLGEPTDTYAGHPPVARPVWQGWYRQESFAGEPMRVTVHRAADHYVFGFAGEGERRSRVTVHLSDAQATNAPPSGSATAFGTGRATTTR